MLTKTRAKSTINSTAYVSQRTSAAPSIFPRFYLQSALFVTHAPDLHACSLQRVRIRFVHHRAPLSPRVKPCSRRYLHFAPQPATCSPRAAVLVDQDCHVHVMRRGDMYSIPDFRCFPCRGRSQHRPLRCTPQLCLASRPAHTAATEPRQCRRRNVQRQLDGDRFTVFVAVLLHIWLLVRLFHPAQHHSFVWRRWRVHYYDCCAAVVCLQYRGLGL
jgi:hypothetical protein